MLGVEGRPWRNGASHCRVVKHAIVIFEELSLHDIAAVRWRSDDELAVLVAQHLQRDGMPDGNDAQRGRSVALAQPSPRERQQQVALKIVRGDGDGGGPRRGLPPGGAG